MIIKKFIGKTEEEALEAARKELGNGIVTMNVRSVKKKGLAGLLGAKQTEVTVALEEERESLKGIRRENASNVQQAPRPVLTKELQGKPADVLGESSQNIERKLDSLQDLLVNRLRQEENDKAEQAAAQEVSSRGEEAQKEEKAVPTEQDKFYRLLYNTMLENEVDEKYVNQIICEVDRAEKTQLPIDYILGNVYQKMVLKFGKAQGIAPAEKIPRVVVFMGPTGKSS